MPNPGPASTITSNSQQLSTNQALRLIAVYKGLPVSAAGDFAMPLINTSMFAPATVITANSSGSTVNVAAATVGIYTGVAAGGTVVLTTAALTGQTTNVFTFIRAATNPATAIIPPAGGNLFVNIVTTVAGGIIDLYLYGYDLS